MRFLRNGDRNIHKHEISSRVKKAIFFSIIVTIIALFLLQCKSTVTVQGAWLKDKITVDGNATEWRGLLQNISDNCGLGIGNDDSSLYICLITEDRAIVRQIMGNGLTVWFETWKSSKNRVGIRFPIGWGSGRVRLPLQEMPHDSAAFERMRQTSLNSLEILGPGKNDTIPMTLSVAESWGGLRLMANGGREEFIYEMKIPLHADTTAKFSAPPARDSLLAITVESPAIERYGASTDEERHEGGGSMGGGGRGGHTGGGGHHRGGDANGFSGRSSSPSEPFSATFIVKLANGKN